MMILIALSVTSKILVLIGITSFLGWYIYQKIAQIKYRRLVQEIQPEISILQKKYLDIFLPTRLISNSDLERFREENHSIFEKIDQLSQHSFFDQQLFNKYGITELQRNLALFEEKKTYTNKIYAAIKSLQDKGPLIIAKYRTLTSPNHYFAYSEMEDLVASITSLKEIIDIVFPTYMQFVEDNDLKQLPCLLNTITSLRKNHNEQFVKQELEACKVYFDEVLGRYPLDQQQRESIVKLEDNCLVIASAGSGKTSTIVSKAKYLVERRNIHPSKILLLTYTKKAAKELSDRINAAGLTSGTFHSLAYRIIAETTGHAPSICSADIALNVFRKLLDTDQHFLKSINTYIINLQSLMQLEHDYLDAFTYYEDRKKYGIQAYFPDADGRLIFTKSEEEKRICSILSRWSIKFRYEHKYQVDTRTPERRQYKPDFTIYFKNEHGEWQRVYLEHFAINKDGQVPRWFGEGTKGGWYVANQKYLEGIEWKRNIHKQYHTTLIETTSAQFRDGTIEQVLRQQLIAHNVPIKEKNETELYSLLTIRNRKIEKAIFTLILSLVTLMKANEKSIDKMLKEVSPQPGHIPSAKEMRTFFILSTIIKPFYDAYQKELTKNREMDFTDAIIHATNLCREGHWKNYDYILVDEFQDISIDRYKFLEALRTKKPKTKLYCVGDDWQSIFRFAGSDMALFYHFEKFFGTTELCKIETTYRFHQPIIEKSSRFIMKNEDQHKKDVHSPIGDTKTTNLSFIPCNGSKDVDVLPIVANIVRGIPRNETIILVGRYNYDATSVGFKGQIQNDLSKITVRVAGRELFFLSVHSAKGLEADHVILINCNDGAYGFPSLIEDDPILDFVLSKKETYPYAEERRLFYVAITRAKKQSYVLYDREHPSQFVGEFALKLPVGSYICPKCLEGTIIPIKDGTAANGHKYRSFACTNQGAKCDFFETKYDETNSPGILITEGMTINDLELIREQRRHSKYRILGF
ncbi:MAG: UvrD-helicase domain-containing protein [Alistipes sp.]|nr:UvrD-helicase domain-containing protein [Alistipes sp.]